MSSVASLSIGTRIAAIRASKGVTQSELAERLGLLSSESISRYERGERIPRISTLRRIAEALDSSIWDILGEPNSEAQQKESGGGEEVAIIPSCPCSDVAKVPMAEDPTLGSLAEGVELLKAVATSDPYALRLIVAGLRAMAETVRNG